MALRALVVAVLLTSCGASDPAPASPTVAVGRTTNAPSPWPPGTVRRFAARWTEAGTAWIYDAVLTLRFDGRSVTGEITWTLVAGDPSDPGLAARVGAVGIESVVGSFAPAEGRLDLHGTAVSDPTLISTDEYQLVIGRDGALGGRTLTNDRDWDGTLVGRAL